VRIRIVQSPTVDSIDGIQLDRFERGHLYDVGELLGAVMITEGWARLAASREPAMLIPLRDIAIIAPLPQTADKRRRRRRARKTR
jgi:SLT domain-containing protein